VCRGSRSLPITNAAATPAAAASPADTAAIVAGTAPSWIGESALAGRP
jgi:hypothetical protein